MPMIPVPEGPSEKPSGAAMPTESIAGIDPSAFGADVGRAVSNQGAAIGKMGDVLEKHALVLQNQKDEALNNQAVTDAIKAEGEISNKFRSNTGIIPQERLPDYMKELEAARTGIRNRLPSPYVQRLFDQATMRPFGYAVNNAASYAATEFKKYSRQQSNDRLDAQLSNAAHAARDDAFDKETSAEVIKATLDEETRSLPPETIDKIVRTKQQAAYEARIQKTYYDDPERALKMIDKYKGTLDPLRTAQLQEQVTNQLISRKAKDIGATAVSGVTPFHQLLRGGVETGGQDPYNTTLDNGRWTGDVTLTNKTVAEVRQIQDKMRTPENRALYRDAHGNPVGSSAIGAPQVVSQTLDKLISEGVVSPNDKFDEATQDRIITSLALGRGNDVEELRKEWQGLRNVPAEQIRTAFAASFGNGTVAPGDRGKAVEYARNRAAEEAKRLGMNEMKTTEFMDAADKAARAEYGRKMAERRDGIIGDKLKVAEVMEGMEKAPTSEAEFLREAGQEGTDAWNRLDPNSRSRYRSMFERNSAHKPMTPERQQAYDTLIGMAQDPDTRREFLDNHDKLINDADLPWGLTKQLNATARKLQQNMEGPAPTDHAMRVLENARLFENTSIKKTPGGQNLTYLHFRGALDAALKAEQQTTAGKPTDDRIREIGAAVMGQIQRPGRFFGTNIDRDTPANVQGMRAQDELVKKNDPALAAQLTELMTKKKGGPLDPGELYKAYNSPLVRRKRASDIEAGTTNPVATPAAAGGRDNDGPY